MRDANHPRLERAEGRQLGELERRAAARAEEAAAAPATPLAAPAEHDEAPMTPPRAVPVWQPWHAGVDADGLDADGAFESMLDANGDTVMRLARAKGHTGTASASSAPNTTDQLLEQTRAKGRLDIQLLEQTYSALGADAGQGPVGSALGADAGQGPVGSALGADVLPSGRLHTQLPEQTRAEGQKNRAEGQKNRVAGRGVIPQGQSPTMPSTRVVELFSPPRVTKALPAGTRLVAGSTFDLHADVDGTRWDFSKAQDRKLALERIRAEEPFLVIGSPPCTMFSSLQNLSATKGTAEWKERRRSAEVLLVFAAAVYKLQTLSGRHFLHEHPAGATSWSHPTIAKLLATSGVSAVVAHQCAFGLQTTTQAGGQAPAQKPTRFMSSAPAVLEALSKRCPGGHSHATLLGGTRARDAAVYPPGLCAAIAQGTAEQLRRDDRARGVRAVRAWHSARSLHAVRATTEVHCDAAQQHTGDEDEQLAAWPTKDVYDEITGATLSPELVRQARAEEIKFMLDWGVWERARTTECWQETGKAPIGSKWVDVNKGDAKKPLIRSRFVVKEIATYKTDDFFAATPPLEALRLLLSMAASSEQAIKVEVLDARKAHLHAFADRTVFVKLPPEVDEPGWCARLVRCLYGTRDAPKRWQAFLDEQLVALGFAKGRASPCCFFHAQLGVRCIVHGDDFVLSGTAGALDEVKARMHERFLLKELGRLGGGEGELKELRVLNRVIQWTPAGLRYEADPRHAEIVVRGVAGTERALSAPGTGSKDFEAAPGEEDNLPERTASLFRSFAARANYLALDRPDISQATKELCRRMSAPKPADLRALARVARYLAGAGRVVYEYPWQTCPVLRVYTDSDFAGCIATRLSTSGGAVMLGTHLLKHWASTQKRITLSSGEAELGAVVRGFSEALGLQSVARDLGVDLQPEVHADSSAAIGICRRSGIGKVRHLAVAQLWVQDLVRGKEVRLHKVLGTENPADLMTKPLARAEIDGHLARLGLSRATGRAETAPRADAEVDTTLARH